MLIGYIVERINYNPTSGQPLRDTKTLYGFNATKHFAMWLSRFWSVIYNKGKSASSTDDPFYSLIVYPFYSLVISILVLY